MITPLPALAAQGRSTSGAEPDGLWLHPAKGRTRDLREAARFKRMGVL